MAQIKTFGEVDARSLEQLKRCMEAGDAEFGVLCADHHPGYSADFAPQRKLSQLAESRSWAQSARATATCR